MLHTMAALFPSEPSLEKQAAMRSFLVALGEIYPCATCAKHFRGYMRDHPFPEVLTKQALQRWLCESHNAVNLRLEKPQVQCEKIEEKWPEKLEADCGCADEEEEKEKKELTLASAAAAAAASASDAPASTLSKAQKKAAEKMEEERDVQAARDEEEARKFREKMQAGQGAGGAAA
jgi:hypothetical protein